MIAQKPSRHRTTKAFVGVLPSGPITSSGEGPRCKPCQRGFDTVRAPSDHWKRDHVGQLQCLHCLNPIPGSSTKLKKVPRVRRVRIDPATGEEILSRSMFCDEDCRRDYELHVESLRTVGNPDTAPYSRAYRDQYDWNR